MSVAGRFITLEGVEGAGKSTALERVRELLEGAGLDVVVTREPGGTALGEDLRTLLLGHKHTGMADDTELLLMFAARAEHLHQVIEPALAAGRWVLCDRFTDATYAYQSGGSGIAWERIAILEKWVQGELQPDITLCFDVAPEVGRSRSGRIKRPDRFEQEQEAFYQRVREAYLQRAREHPQRIHMVDAGVEIDEIQSRLAALVKQLCNLGQ